MGFIKSQKSERRQFQSVVRIHKLQQMCVEDSLYMDHILQGIFASVAQDNNHGKTLKITLNITTLVDLFMT